MQAGIAKITPDDVRAMAREFNRDYLDEVGVELPTAAACIDVSITAPGLGWNATVVATLGMLCSDGDFLAAEQPHVLASAQRLPRWAARDSLAFAKWLVGRSFGKCHGLPVQFRHVT